MGRTQKVRMFKCTPRHPLKDTYFGNIEVCLSKTIIKFCKRKSQSVYDREETNDLSICNMVALEARKATSERSTSSCNSKSLQALNPARKNVMNGML